MTHSGALFGAGEPTESPPPKARGDGPEKGGGGQVTEDSIYERGELQGVTVKELATNELAIRQLVNAYNEKTRALVRSQQDVAEKNGQIEYLRTSPFMAIFALLVSTIGSVLLGMGVNMFTASPPVEAGLALIWFGGALIILAGIANALYPFARKWFNRKPNKA